MADDSKILGETTKAIRAFINHLLDKDAQDNKILINGNVYTGYRVANVTNARSGRIIAYRDWFNSCRPVPISDCTIILTNTKGRASDSRYSVTYQQRANIVWDDSNIAPEASPELYAQMIRDAMEAGSVMSVSISTKLERAGVAILTDSNSEFIIVAFYGETVQIKRD